MTRPKVMNNFEYSVLLGFIAYIGKSSIKDILKASEISKQKKSYVPGQIRDELITIKELNKNHKRAQFNFSKKFGQLKKLRFLNKEGWFFSANYQGILEYIIKQILGQRGDKLKLSQDKELQGILENYLKAEHIYVNNPSLNFLFHNFVLGCAKVFIENRKNKAELEKIKGSSRAIKSFMELCLIYWLNAVENQALVMSYACFSNSLKIK